MGDRLGLSFSELKEKFKEQVSSRLEANESALPGNQEELVKNIVDDIKKHKLEGKEVRCLLSEMDAPPAPPCSPPHPTPPHLTLLLTYSLTETQMRTCTDTCVDDTFRYAREQTSFRGRLLALLIVYKNMNT